MFETNQRTTKSLGQEIAESMGLRLQPKHRGDARAATIGTDKKAQETFHDTARFANKFNRRVLKELRKLTNIVRTNGGLESGNQSSHHQRSTTHQYSRNAAKIHAELSGIMQRQPITKEGLMDLDYADPYVGKKYLKTGLEANMRRVEPTLQTEDKPDMGAAILNALTGKADPGDAAGAGRDAAGTAKPAPKSQSEFLAQIKDSVGAGPATEQPLGPSAVPNHAQRQQKVVLESMSEQYPIVGLLAKMGLLSAGSSIGEEEMQAAVKQQLAGLSNHDYNILKNTSAQDIEEIMKSLHGIGLFKMQTTGGLNAMQLKSTIYNDQRFGNRDADVADYDSEEEKEELVQEKQMINDEEEKVFENIKASLARHIPTFTARFINGFNEYQDNMIEHMGKVIEDRDTNEANKIIQILRSHQSHVTMIDSFVQDRMRDSSFKNMDSDLRALVREYLVEQLYTSVRNQFEEEGVVSIMAVAQATEFTSNDPLEQLQVIIAVMDVDSADMSSGLDESVVRNLKELQEEASTITLNATSVANDVTFSNERSFRSDGVTTLPSMLMKVKNLDTRRKYIDSMLRKFNVLNDKRVQGVDQAVTDFFVQVPDMPFSVAMDQFSKMLSPILGFGSNAEHVKNTSAAAILRHMFSFKTPLVQMHAGTPKLTTVGLVILADITKQALDKGFRNVKIGSLSNQELLKIGTALRADLDPASGTEIDVLKLVKKAETVHVQPVTLAHAFINNARIVDSAILKAEGAQQNSLNLGSEHGSINGGSFERDFMQHVPQANFSNTSLGSFNTLSLRSDLHGSRNESLQAAANELRQGLNDLHNQTGTLFDTAQFIQDEGDPDRNEDSATKSARDLNATLQSIASNVYMTANSGDMAFTAKEFSESTMQIVNAHEALVDNEEAKRAVRKTVSAKVQAIGFLVGMTNREVVNQDYSDLWHIISQRIENDYVSSKIDQLRRDNDSFSMYSMEDHSLEQSTTFNVCAAYMKNQLAPILEAYGLSTHASIDEAAHVKALCGAFTAMISAVHTLPMITARVPLDPTNFLLQLFNAAPTKFIQRMNQFKEHVPQQDDQLWHMIKTNFIVFDQLHKSHIMNQDQTVAMKSKEIIQVAERDTSSAYELQTRASQAIREGLREYSHLADELKAVQTSMHEMQVGHRREGMNAQTKVKFNELTQKARNLEMKMSILKARNEAKQRVETQITAAIRDVVSANNDSIINGYFVKNVSLLHNIFTQLQTGYHLFRSLHNMTIVTDDMQHSGKWVSLEDRTIGIPLYYKTGQDSVRVEEVLAHFNRVASAQQSHDSFNNAAQRTAQLMSPESYSQLAPIMEESDIQLGFSSVFLEHTGEEYNSAVNDTVHEALLLTIKDSLAYDDVARVWPRIKAYIDQNHNSGATQTAQLLDVPLVASSVVWHKFQKDYAQRMHHLADYLEANHFGDPVINGVVQSIRNSDSMSIQMTVNDKELLDQLQSALAPAGQVNQATHRFLESQIFMLGELDKEGSASTLRTLARNKFVPSNNTFRANFARFAHSEELAQLTSAAAFTYTQMQNNVHWAVSAFKRMAGNIFDQNGSGMFVPPAGGDTNMPMTVLPIKQHGEENEERKVETVEQPITAGGDVSQKMLKKIQKKQRAASRKSGLGETTTGSGRLGFVR